jgi:predicted MFS family arabinose efflux permease
VKAPLHQVGRVVGIVFGNPDLRREQIAYFFFNGAEWAVWIAMLVYAFDRGGATMAGLVALIQLVPAMLFAPFASALADRYRPALVLTLSYVAQGIAMGATAAVLLLDGPPWLAYATAALSATAVTVTRPTLAALTPALARAPEELTAANVVSGWNESISVLIAPALAGVILATWGAGWVFLLMALLVLGGAALVRPVQGPPAAVTTNDDVSTVSGLLEGFRVLRREPAARLLVGLLGSQYVAIGMLDVLYVVLAIDTLGMGQGGAGYLNAAFGAGGALGIGVTASLVGRTRLMPSVLSSLVVWASAFLVLTVWSQTAGALLLLAVAGAARSLFDVAGRTLLQRTAPADVLARVFGILEAMIMAGTAVGALLAPLLLNLGGTTVAIVGVGCMLPLLALLGGRRLLVLDATANVPIVQIGLLRSLRLFSALPPPQIEGLARCLDPLSFAAGGTVIRQGDAGDCYYAIAEGEVEVTKDGAVVNVLGRGEGFGEIALLHEVPRTASVTALTSVTLFALEKEAFLEVLTGHPAAHAAAHAVAKERMPVASS